MNDETLSSLRLDGFRVLVLEDEPLLAFELIEDLEQVGAVPIGPASTVEEAFVLLRSNERLDAAILNVQLRGQLSFPVADALIERSVPFVFVTGNDEMVRKHYPDVPCHPKPSDLPKVIAALGKMVGSSAAERRTSVATK